MLKLTRKNKFFHLRTMLIYFLIMISLPAYAMDEKEWERKYPRNIVRILTVDGEGVRGIIPVTILEGIEEHLQAKLEGQKVNLAEYFDIMAGTSTGGITVLSLSTGKSAEELAKLYLDEGENIFKPIGKIGKLKSYTGPKYKARSLEKVLKKHLGDIWLKEASAQVLIPADDDGQKCAYLFDSHAARLKSYNFMIRDVARVTSAGPTYFKAATIKDEKGYEHTYLDGGVYANDPTFEAVQKAEERFPGCDIFIVSLGTGEAPRKFGNLSLKGGKLAWAEPISGHLMDGAQDWHLQYLEHLKSLMQQQGRNLEYYRIQVPIDPLIKEMDVAKNIRSLREAGNFLLDPQNPQGHYLKLTGIVDNLMKGNLRAEGKKWDEKKLEDIYLTTRRFRETELDNQKFLISVQKDAKDVSKKFLKNTEKLFEASKKRDTEAETQVATFYETAKNFLKTGKFFEADKQRENEAETQLAKSFEAKLEIKEKEEFPCIENDRNELKINYDPGTDANNPCLQTLNLPELKWDSDLDMYYYGEKSDFSKVDYTQHAQVEDKSKSSTIQETFYFENI